MGVLDRLASAIGIRQASLLPVETPPPRVEDAVVATAGVEGHDYSSIRQLLQSEPAKIEYLFAQSTEWATVVARLRMETWRRGVHVVPAHDRYCALCGQGQDGEVRQVGDPRPPDEALQCESCGGIEFRDADPAEKHRVEEFLKDCNAEHDTIGLVGGRKLEEQLKYGRGYVVFAFAYTMKESKAIDRMVLKGVYPGDPGKLAPVKRKNGRRGGAFVCVWCRGRENYQAATAPGACHQCQAPLYEAWFVENNGAQRLYYLRNEVHETKWPFLDGSSPVTRLWTKANTIILMDWYAGAAVDPRKPKGFGKVLVTMGGDEAAMEKWAQRQAEKRKKDPNKVVHLHIPAPPGGLADLKMGATVLDLTDTEFRAQLPELRKAFEESIRKAYFLSEIQMGSSEGLGGLKQETQGMKSTGDVVEELKEHEVPWLDLIPAYLGASEWRVEYVEDEETSNADDVLKQLDIAAKATDLSLSVEWIGDTAHIKDGPVEKKQATFPGLPPFEGGREAPAGETRFASFDDLRQVLRQALGAPSSDASMPPGVAAVFGGPSGATAAEEAIFSTYAGLTAEQGLEVRREVAASLSQPQGWSLESVAARVRPVLEAAGVDPVAAAWRSRVIAATETRAAISEWQQRLYRAAETERGVEFLYRDVGPDDARTTKLSYWCREQIGDGKRLDDVLRILDEGVRLAVAGAFADGGSLARGPGQPVRLPAGFQRRGFLVHFGDRDRIVKAGQA